MTIPLPPPLKQILTLGLFAASSFLAGPACAQNLPQRIPARIANSERIALPGTVPPIAQASFEAGRKAADDKLSGITLVFKRSAAQEADLQALIAAQSDPASPLFHQWLEPEQYAARFGMADADLESVQSWLQQQGFAVDSIARSRDAIRFSGSVGQVEQAFSTQMHDYQFGANKIFAPSTALSVPAALAPVVAGFHSLSSLRPKPHKINHSGAIAVPNYTFNSSPAMVLFAPGDIQTAYGLKALASSGSTGAGQTIAIIGQSAVSTTDITNFQTAAGLATKAPNLVLVSGSGNSTACSGDQGESDLDLEWSGAAAPGATINFVYTGVDSGKTCTTTSHDVFDALMYAIDQKLGNVISLSYGYCESEVAGTTLLTLMDQYGAKAASYGQTLVVSSGDDGSTACYWDTSATTTARKALDVSFPADSPYVTAVGGTEIVNSNNQVGAYWSGTSGIDSVNTLTQHIPEVAWNDDSSTNGLSAGGGGVSSIPRPDWQKSTTYNVPGLPSTSTYAGRLMPDISLYSSPNNPGYLFCSGDSSDLSTAFPSSCNSGKFYYFNSSTNLYYFNIAGGTSFAAPIFAGMVAVLNQNKGYTGGQGQINPNLYLMASSTPLYASAFYDVTAGGPSGVTGEGNECEAGSTYCSTAGAASFHTTTGYDMATGLGSINPTNLFAAWGNVVASTTTVTPAPTSVATGASVTFTVTVSATSTPTGIVDLTLDGSSVGTCTLTSGACTYPTTFSAAGTHTLAAAYEGDTTHGGSSGSGSVTVTSVTTVATTTTVTPSTTTPTVGASMNFAIAVASTGSTPTGSVLVKVDGTTVGTYSLTSGAYTYATAFSSAGAHTVAAFYQGDSTHAISNGSASVTAAAVPTACTGANCFTVAVSPGSSTSNPLTITQGTSNASTVTLTSTNSYAGTVGWSLFTNSTSDTTAWSSNGCYTITSKTLTANAATTTTLTLYTSSTACAAVSAARPGTKVYQILQPSARKVSQASSPLRTFLPLGGIALGGILLFGLRRRAHWLKSLGCLMIVGAFSIAIGCGGGSTSSSSSSGSTTTYVPKGTYQLSLYGYDTTACTSTTLSAGTCSISNGAYVNVIVN